MRWGFRHRAIIKGHWRDYQSGPDWKRQMADPYSDENFRKRSLYRRSGARKTKIVDHQQVKAGEDNLIIAKCTHEPIISYELFNAVQEYRKQICEESKATPKRPYTPNIFKGKVFCADCGRSLHRQRAERRKGPDTYWFHCLTNSRIEKIAAKAQRCRKRN